MPAQTESCGEETFAPILYVLTYDDLDEAIALHNDVPQGLSSSDLHQRPAGGRAVPRRRRLRLRHRQRQHRHLRRRDRRRLRRREGDRRRPRVRLDAWKAYMRRATNTVNYSSRLALAQNVSFL